MKSFLENIVDSFARKVAEHDILDNATVFKESFKEAYPSSDSMRMPADVLLYHFYNRPTQLFLGGHYPATYLETYAILERFALVTFPRKMSKDVHIQDELKNITEKKTLSNLLPFFVAMKIWDDKCSKFIKKFTKIRNAIAHKNDEKLDKALGKSHLKNEWYEWNNDDRFTRKETLHMLLDSIELTLRLNKTRKSRKWRQLSSKL